MASVFDGLPAGLPALLLADKVLDRAERAGTPVDVPSTRAISGTACWRWSPRHGPSASIPSTRCGTPAGPVAREPPPLWTPCSRQTR